MSGYMATTRIPRARRGVRYCELKKPPSVLLPEMLGQTSLPNGATTMPVKDQTSKQSRILDIEIVDIVQCDDDDGTLLGTCNILGVPHHAEFVPVHTVKDEDGYDMQEGADDDIHGRYDAMQGYYDGVYDTVHVPNFEGEYVVHIFPFCI